MSKARDTLRRIENAVFAGHVEEVQRLLATVGADGVPADEIVRALAAGMDRVREQARLGKLAAAEILVSAEAFREGVRAVQGRGGLSVSPDRAGVVIGVVPGDVHDMGKNIVAVVLEAAGHPVVDVGKDAAFDAFVAAIERTAPRPAVVALSTMMSTTMENMGQLVRDLRRFDDGLRVVAGGAALDARVARSLGAHGYADSAATAPEEIARVLATPR